MSMQTVVGARVRRRWQIEPRAATPLWVMLGVLALALLLGLTLAGGFLALAGKSPLAIYETMLSGAFGSTYGLSETLLRTTPLLLCGLGIAVAARMQLWNVGAEGQFHLGAVAATWVAMRWSHAPAALLLPAMAIAGALAGGLWALLPGAGRALLGLSETITTLLLNYVAINIMLFLVYGPWKDPKAVGFPLTPPYSDNASLPALLGRLHIGLPVAVTLALLLYVVLWHTRWGYEVRVIGANQNAARYAGLPVLRNILVVFLLAGALAGLAGMMEISGVIHRLQKDISPGYGYSAIIVAYLARLNPLALPLVAFAFGGLQVGGYSIQMKGVPVATVYMIQGTILFCMLAAEFLIRHRVRLVSREEGM